MGVGFIHGVMNTDNTQLAGETIDYGPCAFMDHYDPGTVFSSIDHHGRYAYGNQPNIAQWNLGRFAETLIPILGDTQDEGIARAQEAIDAFGPLFNAAYFKTFGDKLGFADGNKGDADLMLALFELMEEKRADFTNTFRALCDAAEGKDSDVIALLGGAEKSRTWLKDWRARLSSDGRSAEECARSMRNINPAFIPRNHRVEAALDAAVSGNLEPFDLLLDTLQRPFEEQPERSHLKNPPEKDEVVQATFCGT
jgi:uncharacterized protein YdiU (UPF0061 family)